MPDDDRQEGGKLSHRIEELESLLGEQRLQQGPDSELPRRLSNIPILDEVVTPEDFPDEEPAPSRPSEQEIAELVEKLETQFSRELDEMVGVLKSNLKANITEELLLQFSNKNDSDRE